MGMGRTSRRLALGSGLALAALAMTGCRLVPFRRPTPPGPVEARPEPPGVEALPALPELRPIGDAEAFAGPAPTPLLDAAAARDESLRRVSVSLPADPAPQPEPAPAVADPAAPSPTTVPDSSAYTPSFGVGGPLDAPAVADSRGVRPVDAPPDAESSWVSGLDRLRMLAAERAREGGTEAEAWAGRERLLACLAEPGDPSLWEAVASAIAQPDEAPPPDAPTPEPTRAPDPAPAPVEAAARDVPALAIADLRVCRKVLGFGRTEPLASPDLRPGREILLYAQIDGLRDEEAPEGVRSRFSARIAVVPASGGEPAWESDLGEREDLCDRRRRDFFANFRLTVPADLPPGDYEIRLTLRDGLAGSEAARGVPVRVGR